MKTNILTKVVCLLIVTGLSFTCEKKDDKIVFRNIEDLYAQPLTIIQKCVQGKWLIKGTHGGHAGWNPAPDSTFIEIASNKMNNEEIRWIKHTKQDWEWQTPFDTYAIQYIDSKEPSLYFSSIRSDSLFVGFTPNRSCYDCFTGQLWVRSK